MRPSNFTHLLADSYSRPAGPVDAAGRSLGGKRQRNDGRREGRTPAGRNASRKMEIYSGSVRGCLGPWWQGGRYNVPNRASGRYSSRCKWAIKEWCVSGALTNERTDTLTECQINVTTNNNRPLDQYNSSIFARRFSEESDPLAQCPRPLCFIRGVCSIRFFFVSCRYTTSGRFRSFFFRGLAIFLALLVRRRQRLFSGVLRFAFLHLEFCSLNV